MARTARWMARAVAGSVMAGLFLIIPVTVALVGPAGPPAVAAGTGTVTTAAATTVVGGSFWPGRRWS
jgi:hypothetical protein